MAGTVKWGNIFQQIVRDGLGAVAATQTGQAQPARPGQPAPSGVRVRAPAPVKSPCRC